MKSGIISYAYPQAYASLLKRKEYKSITTTMDVLIGVVLAARIDAFVGIIGDTGVALFLASGIAYATGLLFYGLGSKKEWMHAVFHVLCLVGSIIHCVCICFYLI